MMPDMPDYMIPPEMDPDRYVTYLGTCNNCGRWILGYLILGRPYPFDCPCWNIEPNLEPSPEDYE